MCFAPRRRTKAGDQRFDCSLRSDFAAFFSTHSIGHGKEPAVRAAFVLRSRQYVAGIVFVVIPYTAHVGQFGEFKIQHGEAGGSSEHRCLFYNTQNAPKAHSLP